MISLSRFTPSHKAAAAALCWITLLVITLSAFYWHVLTAPAGVGLSGSDYGEVIYPDTAFVSWEWRGSGTLPLWNPHPLLGYSIVGNPTYSIFYPPYWVALWIARGGFDQLIHIIGLLTVLHVLWASLGFMILARTFRAPWWVAFILGVSAAGSFTIVRVYAGHFTMLQALAWVPWFFAGLQSLHNRVRKRTVLLTGLVLALLILAGHPPVMYLVLVGGVLQVLWWLIVSPRRRALVLPISAIMFIGIGLSAPSLIPWILQIPETARAAEHETIAVANDYYMPISQAPGLLLPNLYGIPTSPDGYQGAPDYEETTAYLGVLPLLSLLLLLLNRSARSRETLFWAGIVLLGIWLSIGFSGGLYRLLVELPLLRNFRAPGRFLLLSELAALIVLSLVLGQFAQKTVTERSHQLRPALLVFLMLSVVLLAFALLIPDRYIGTLLLQSAALALFATIGLWCWTTRRPALRYLGISILCLTAIVDTARFGSGLVQTKPLSVGQSWQYAAETIPAQAVGRVVQLPPPMGAPQGVNYGKLFSTQGYDQLFSRYLFELLDGLKYDRYVDPNDPLTRLFNIQYAIVPQDLKNYGFISTRDFRLIDQRGDYHLYENPDAIRRAYIVTRYAVEPGLERAKQRLWAGEFNTDNVLLDTVPPCQVAASGSPAVGNTATIEGYTANKVDIRVHIAQPGAALLVLADAFDPGWRVTINGEPVQLLRADWTLRAVCVPSGESTVEFTYAPTSLPLGLAALALTATGLTVYLIAMVVVARRRTSASGISNSI